MDPLVLKNAELLQQIALLKWFESSSAEGKTMLEIITKLRIGHEIYDRITHRRALDALKGQAISAVCDYIKANPRATEDEMVSQISNIVRGFKEEVKLL